MKRKQSVLRAGRAVPATGESVADSVRRIMALALVTAGVAAMAMPAQSQEVQDELEEVVITGTSIKRAQAEGALPVQVFGQEEIARSGRTSVMDFVQGIPAMQGFEPISDSVGGGGGGLSTASLHDVGSQYTLVLLNGRRVAPADSATTVDLNSIPLAAIERVEVLTDGASALYGADAIAGVVNFILKRGEAPLTVDVRGSLPEHGAGEQFNASVSKGFGRLAADGYEAFLALSYDRQKRMKARDRGFASTGIITGTQGDISYDFFNGSYRSVPPNVDVYGLDGEPSNYLNPYYELNGQCPPDHVDDGGGQCIFDYTTTLEIAPEVERWAAYASGRKRLGDSGWNLVSDFVAVKADTRVGIAPYPADFALYPDHPYFATYVAPYISAADVANTDAAVVTYRLFDLGNRGEDYATRALHFVLGVEGEAAGWDISGAGTYSTQTQKDIYTSGWPLADLFDAAIENQLVDPFPYAAGEMPADQIEALRATQYLGVYSTNKMEMSGLQANAQRGLFALPGGDFIASVGADYRRNSYRTLLNDVAAQGLILFDTPQEPFSLSRSSWGAYAEVLAPVLPSLEFTGAVRHDGISAVRDRLSGVTSGRDQSASTYKLGLKWSPVSSLAVRGSYGTGFRVASMREIAQPVIDWGVTGGTYNCPFNAGYDPLGYVAAGYTCPNGQQYEMKMAGNPDLKPEKSRQWNAGFVWSPSQAFSVGMNYWSVQIRDAVTSVSESLLFARTPDYLDLFTTKYVPSVDRTYVAVLDTPINIGRQLNEGIDWDLKGTMDVGIGRLTGSLAGTYLLKSRYTLPGTDDEWATSLGQYGSNDAVSFRQIVTAQLALKRGALEHSLQARYRSGYRDVQFAADDHVIFDAAGDPIDGGLKVSSYTLVDWRTSWQVNDVVTLTVGADNLLDRKPPLSLRYAGSHQLGYDPRYADAYLRTWTLGFTARF